MPVILHHCGGHAIINISIMTDDIEIDLDFTISYEFDVNKFISGYITLNSTDGTTCGSKWELSARRNIYILSLGPICPSYKRYITYYFDKDHPDIIEFVSKLADLSQVKKV